MVVYTVERIHTGEWEGLASEWLDSGNWFGEILSFYASFHAAWEVARSHKLNSDYTVAVVMYVKNGNNSFDRQSIHYVTA